LDIVTENVKEEYAGNWDGKKKLLQKQITEPQSPWKNKAKLEIQELKKHFRFIVNTSRCQMNMGLWNLAELCQMIPRELTDERTPIELVTGNNPKFSHLYSWMKY